MGIVDFFYPMKVIELDTIDFFDQSVHLQILIIFCYFEKLQMILEFDSEKIMLNNQILLAFN